MAENFKPGSLSRYGRSRRRTSAFEQLRLLLSPNRRQYEITEDHVISLLMVRRGREAVFGQDLFCDPAWDILLELYAAHLGQRRASVSQLAATTGVPQSTTGRWVAALAARGYVVADLDGREPAQVWVALTGDGAAMMKRLVDDWISAFLSI